MFTYYFVTLAAPFEHVERRLLAGLNALDDLAGAAYREGEEIRVRMGLGIEPHLLAKAVRLEAGAALRSVSETTIPLVWEATGASVLFPRMEGEFVLAAMGPELTQLAFRGTYRPPLGVIGRAIDRTMLHRVAESSVKGFVDRIACALTADVVQTSDLAVTSL